MTSYTTSERRALLDLVSGGAIDPPCPRCGSACTVIRTRPRADVAYVRDRVVVRCTRCLCSCAADADGPPG